MLRSKRDIPAGTGLRCPGCQTSFTAPDPEAEAEASNRGMGAGVLIALAAVLVLGVGGIAAGLVFALRPVSKPTPLVSADANRDDQASEDRKRQDEELEKTRKELADAQAKLEQDRKKIQHDALVARGDKAMLTKDFPDAVKEYRAALAILPDEKATLAALGVALAAELEAKKGGDDAEKRKKEVDRYLADAREFSKDKRYAAAVRALESALVLDADNKKVSDALDEARKALDADQAEKKRLADYQANLAAAKAAFKAEQFVDALQKAQAALALLPDDVEADRLVKAIQVKLANVGDVKKRQDAFDRLMDQARKARDAGRFNDATQSVNAALKLFPDDREAKRLADNIKTSLAKVKADNAKLLAQAETQLQRGNLKEARRLLADALQNWPDDANADRALREVDRLITVYSTPNAQNAALLDYQQSVRLGQMAVLLKNWVVAALAYGRAVELMPNDEVSYRELRRARKLIDLQQLAGQEYTKQMQTAANEMTAQRYRHAIVAYEAALIAVPNDAAALKGLSDARYSRAMQVGNELYAALQKKNPAPTLEQKNAALRAFQAALDERPNDQVASAKLQIVKGIQITNKNPSKDKVMPKSDFQQRLDAAKAAFEAGRLTDALDKAQSAYRAATNANDRAEAAQLVKLIQARIDKTKPK
jgi:hypothetical protein